MTHPESPLAGRQLAGYRVLRSLARDEHAELLLGFADIVPPSAAAERPAAAMRTVAIKAMPSTAENWLRLTAAVSALERARGGHVVELIDVEGDDETLCLVFERLPRGDLTELLRVRARLDAGEAVTLLAPLADVVSRMHGAGVAHGALGARTVLFRDDGAPVVVGFGSASLFPPGAPEVVLEQQPHVVSDRRALRALAMAVLTRVEGSRMRAARALLAEVEGCADDLVAVVLSAGIFEVAAAVPVRFVADEPRPSAGTARLVPIGVPDRGETQIARSRSALLARVVPDAWVQRVLDAVDGSPAAPLLAALSKHWVTWSVRRRRVVLAGVAATAGLLVALVVVPAPSEHATPAPAEGVAGVHRSASAAPSLSATKTATMTAAIDGNDPLAAASALVTARDRCLRSLSLLCLDGVDQQDSAALRADRAAVAAAQGGGEAPPALGDSQASGAPTLVERLGDSALVLLAAATSATTAPSTTADSAAQRQPASLLLVKSEAGWRIRDLIVARNPPSG